MGTLPRALAARGHRVMVVSPRYFAPSAKSRYEGVTDTGVRARLDLCTPDTQGSPAARGGGGVHEVRGGKRCDLDEEGERGVTKTNPEQ
jgi:hypothetical protein